MKLKDNMTIEQAAHDVKRSFLIRCFSKVAKQYPPVMSMLPEEGADELLRLEQENIITIELKSEGYIINCRINKLN